MRFCLLHFSISLLTSYDRISGDSEDDENVVQVANAAEDMNAQDRDEESDDNDGSSGLTEDSNNEENDASEANGHMNAQDRDEESDDNDGPSGPTKDSNNEENDTSEANGHHNQTDDENVVHAEPIPSVEHQPDPALSVVISLATRKRARLTASAHVQVDNDLVCNDPGCETLISNVDVLRCDSPGCYLVVSPVYSTIYFTTLPNICNHIVSFNVSRAHREASWRLVL